VKGSKGARVKTKRVEQAKSGEVEPGTRCTVQGRRFKTHGRTVASQDVVVEILRFAQDDKVGISR